MNTIKLNRLVGKNIKRLCLSTVSGIKPEPKIPTATAKTEVSDKVFYFPIGIYNQNYYDFIKDNHSTFN